MSPVQDGHSETVRMMPLDNSILILVRIPKSGSTSVSLMVRKPFLVERTLAMGPSINPDADLSLLQNLRIGIKTLKKRTKKYHAITIPQMQRAIQAREQDLDLITGHIHYGFVKLKTKQPRHITVLRDPFSRAQSDYFYAKERMVKKTGRNYYQSERLKIAATQDFESYLSFLAEHEKSYANSASRFIIGESDFETAFDCLEKGFYHYGLLENLPQFIEGLSQKTGLPDFEPVHARKSSKPQERIPVSGAERRLIERLYDADLECYEQARAKLQI